jgi:hypothetical protein
MANAALIAQNSPVRVFKPSTDPARVTESDVRKPEFHFPLFVVRSQDDLAHVDRNSGLAPISKLAPAENCLPD